MRLAVLLACATLLSAPLARADNAATIDAEARVAYAKKDYAEAARLFARAFVLEPHPATKFNEARARDQAGQRAAAADAYDVALTSPGLDQDRVTVATRRLGELKTQLVTLDVTRPIGGRIVTAAGDTHPIPSRFHLDAGTHELTVHFTDSTSTKRVVTGSAGSVIAVAVDPPVAVPVAPAEPKKPPPEVLVGRAPSRAPAYVALAVGGALTITSGFLGVLTVRARNDYVDLRGDERDRDAHVLTFATISAWQRAL